MCNRWKNQKRDTDIFADFSQLKLPLVNKIGDIPNRGLVGDIKPTDPAYVIRSNGDFEILRWGWPSNRGPVINIRGENGPYKIEVRGLAPMTSFYETTDSATPGKKTKDWWEFIPTSDTPLAFPVVIRGDAFSLITTAPGADIISIHDRQPTVLPMDRWAAWLMTTEDWKFEPSPPGMWTVAPKDFSKPDGEPNLL